MTLILSKNPDEPEFSLSLSGRLDDMLPGDTYLANLSNIYFQLGRRCFRHVFAHSNDIFVLRVSTYYSGDS